MQEDVTKNIAQYEQRANQFNTEIQNLKQKRAASQARYEGFQQREDEVRQRISAIGLTPETLKPKIAENQKMLDGIFENLEKIMPNSQGVFPNGQSSDPASLDSISDTAYSAPINPLGDDPLGFSHDVIPHHEE